MRTPMLITLLLFCLFTLASAASTPDEADAFLFSLAEALQKKNLARLREFVDMQSIIYTRTILNAPGYPRKDPLETLVGTSSPDSFRRVEDLLLDRLGTGEEQNECREARRPGCAWSPEAVGKAILIEDTPDAAIYAVDNNHSIRTWILLGMESGRLRVWAVAESDREARLIASAQFRETLSRVRAKLPSLLEEKENARITRNNASQEEHKKRATEIERRN